MDAEDAVEASAFAALNVPAMTSLAPVFQHVPEDTPPPVVIIADMDSEGGLGDKDGRDERITLTVTAVISGEQRKPLRQIKRQVKQLLDGRTESRGGWTLQFTYLNADGVLLNGEDYVGNFRFSVLALSET